MWGPGYGTESNYLRVYVGQLRKKLGDDAAHPAPDPHRARHRLPLDRAAKTSSHALEQLASNVDHADHASRSSRTRTGTASGTRRSRRSGCGSCKLLDALLPMLERDLSYSRFLLDGQTAVLDDYLEVRPEARGRARPARARRAGCRSGRGWSSWTSSWCRARRWCATCSSGIARGAQLGGVMEVGYLPDMFGHVAQMPQLLRLAGLRARGRVARRSRARSSRPRSGGRRPTVRACAPSTSTARTRTVATSPTTPSGSSLRAVDYEHELGAGAPRRDMLLMNGTDHQMPQPWLGRVVAEANAIQDDYEFVVTSLPEYLAAAADRRARHRAAASCVRARAPTCSWAWRRTASTCTSACAAAERALEKRRRAAVARCSCRAEQYPHALARHRVAQARAQQRARLVVRVQRTTRSSTRCVVRYAEARQIGDGLDARRGARARGRRSTRPRGATVVVNPTGRGARRARRGTRARRRGRASSSDPTVARAPDADARRGRRRRVPPDGDRPEGALGARPHARDRVRGPRRSRAYEVTRHAATAARRRAARGRGPARTASTSPSCKRADARARRTRAHRCAALSRSHAGAPRAVRHRRRSPASAGRRFTRRSTATSPAGARSTSTGSARRTSTCAVDDRPRRPARTRSRRPTACASRPRPARRRRRRRRHLQLLAARPTTSSIDRPDAVRGRRRSRPGRCARAGRDRRRLHAGRRTRVGDARRARARSDETVRVTVRTTLELRAGERFLRVAHEIDNQARDHRLRAHFPLPAPVDRLRRRVRVHGRAPRAHRRGRTARVRPADVPVAPLRRRVRRRRRARARCTTACSNTRSSTTAASSRSRCSARSATSRASNRRCDRTPPARPIRSHGPQMLGAQRAEYAVLLARRRLARGRLLRRRRRVPRAVRAGTRARRSVRARARRPAPRCASTAPRSRRCCATPGGLVVRVFRTAAETGPGHDRTRGRARARLRRRPPRPSRRARSKARSTLRPWQIATLATRRVRLARAEELVGLDRLVEARER